MVTHFRVPHIWHVAGMPTVDPGHGWVTSAGAPLIILGVCLACLGLVLQLRRCIRADALHAIADELRLLRSEVVPARCATPNRCRSGIALLRGAPGGSGPGTQSCP